jgi:predicted RNA-binding protein (TIGR00451 family)
MRKLNDFPYILDYLYGSKTHEIVDLNNTRFTISKRTGKVKQIYYNNRLFGTFRPNGSLAPTPYAFSVLSKSTNFKQNTVIIKKDSVNHIKGGSSVFVQNLKKVGENIYVGSDVFIVGPDKSLIGIGKSTIQSKQIEHLKSGVCVKNRVMEEWASK